MLRFEGKMIPDSIKYCHTQLAAHAALPLAAGIPGCGQRSASAVCGSCLAIGNKIVLALALLLTSKFKKGVKAHSSAD